MLFIVIVFSFCVSLFSIFFELKNLLLFIILSRLYLFLIFLLSIDLFFLYKIFSENEFIIFLLLKNFDTLLSLLLLLLISLLILLVGFINKWVIPLFDWIGFVNKKLLRNLVLTFLLLIIDKFWVWLFLFFLFSNSNESIGESFIGLNLLLFFILFAVIIL